MSRADHAVSVFQEGFSCSQAVFSSSCEELGLDRERALKISTAFGGGMGHCGEACGAVTGALMAIGLKHGRTRADDREAKEKTYGFVQDFIRRFKSAHGSVNCTELIGYDLGTEEGIQNAREKNLFRTLCINFVRSAAEILDGLL